MLFKYFVLVNICSVPMLIIHIKTTYSIKIFLMQIKTSYQITIGRAWMTRNTGISFFCCTVWCSAICFKFGPLIPASRNGWRWVFFHYIILFNWTSCRRINFLYYYWTFWKRTSNWKFSCTIQYCTGCGVETNSFKPMRTVTNTSCYTRSANIIGVSTLPYKANKTLSSAALFLSFLLDWANAINKMMADAITKYFFILLNLKCYILDLHASVQTCPFSPCA